jgi:hypothetical protein
MRTRQLAMVPAYTGAEDCYNNHFALDTYVFRTYHFQQQFRENWRDMTSMKPFRKYPINGFGGTEPPVFFLLFTGGAKENFAGEVMRCPFASAQAVISPMASG